MPIHQRSPNQPGFSSLYPSCHPYDSGWLNVDNGHRVYWETSGNPHGMPALLIHGGPGGASRPRDRRYFDPNRYRIIAFDQRGCGQSTPAGELQANTTTHLINDIERLRIHLGIKHWMLFGGSWGATLALAYAQAHPRHVSRLVLRGVFTARASELRWLYQGGAAHFHAQAWERFRRPIPASQKNDLVAAYAAVLGGPRTEAAMVLARAWCDWEDALMDGPTFPAGSVDTVDPVGPVDAVDLEAWKTARIGTHYLAHGAFLEEGALLSGAGKLQGRPGTIVQGRYDLVTPMATAWALHTAWPDSILNVVEGAGHASDEPGVTRVLLEAIESPA